MTADAIHGTDERTAAPASLFRGYDRVSGNVRSAAVAGSHDVDHPKSSVDYNVCFDASELAKSLHITQSLSVAYGKVGSVDQKMVFLKSLKITTYSVSIVVSARHPEARKVMRGAELKKSLTRPKSRKEIAQFVRVHGDSFVSSITTGGEYFAVYTFYSETAEEQRTLVTDLRSKGILSGVTVNIGLQNKLDEFSKSTKIRSTLSQTISGIDNPNMPSESDIIQFALDYTSLELTAPAVLDFEVEGYENAVGVGSFEPIPDNRIYFTGTKIVGGLTADLVRVTELKDQIVWLKDTYEHYGYTGDDALAKAFGLVEADLDAIDGQIRAWDKDPTQTFTKPSLPSLALGPRR